VASALGFSLHTGWAVAVAVAGSHNDPVVLLRSRVELIAPDLPRQAYHAAADLPAAEADDLVQQVSEAAAKAARDELARLRDELAALGDPLAAVGLVAEPRAIPADVQRVLASHALMHSAEGDMYREALAGAAVGLDLTPLQVSAKRLPAVVEDALGLAPTEQQALLTTLGRELGPPWQADHKRATLMALLAS
jgi:hypothetical protein